MKKEAKKALVVLLIIAIISLLIANIISASLLGNIRKLISGLFSKGNEAIKSGSGGLYTTKPSGSSYADELTELIKKLNGPQTPNPSGAAGYECSDCDFTGDGKVDGDDIQLILSLGVFNRGLLCNPQNNWCQQTDINEDGYMDANDIQIILDLAVFNAGPCPCDNECPNIGAKQCNGNNVENCDDYDPDVCLEWGGSNPCPNGQICSNGNCEENIPDIEISIATLKNKYKVSQKIELTDPR